MVFGSGKLFILLIVGAALPNIAEFFASGPRFGGLSGVVYALLGYSWLRTRLQPDCGLAMPPALMGFMLVWLVLGFLDMLGTPTANMEKTKVNFAVLSGPSGMGAVKLMADNDAGTSANEYNVTIAAANDEVTAGLINGSIDIAAVASNLASVLYNKTEGGIQAAAVSGLGVLYILENGDTVHSVNDLAGKTVYATGQGANPEYVLNYLLAMNGEEPLDVDIQWKTADEVSALMASGEAKICMLPVPAATGVMMKNADVREALDLSAEWDGLNNGSKLTQTAIVVRREFAEQHKDAVDAFLKEYAASVDYVNTNVTDAAALVAQYGITPNAKIAEAAIPKANLVCITGVNEIRDAIQGYYQVLWQADPKSVGGTLPDDAFYYGE
ncbi:MAG: ABC transporter substrate-binding protein [Clostridia bacterium]|nr:ABC transporter substrate-binding protein [Clostridia bacterium]